MYRVGPYIAATIRSVLAQTYPCFELLLVDDGSPDDTAERCRLFLSDTRVSLLRQPNRGCPAARNHGIRRARGTLLAMLDADDTWSPDKLEQQVRHIQGKPSAGIVYCGAALIDEGGRFLGLSHRPPAGPVDLLTMFRNNPICSPSAALIRRQVLADIQFQNRAGEAAFFDETVECADDFECWVRVLATTSWEIAAMPISLAQYRVRAESNTTAAETYPQHWRHVLSRIECYAPELVARHGKAATARILRYLAQRKFLALGSANVASRLARAAIITDPSMLVQEPFRTLLTVAATHAALLLPAPVRPAMIAGGRHLLNGLTKIGVLPSQRMRFDDA